MVSSRLQQKLSHLLRTSQLTSRKINLVDKQRLWLENDWQFDFPGSDASKDYKTQEKIIFRIFFNSGLSQKYFCKSRADGPKPWRSLTGEFLVILPLAVTDATENYVCKLCMRLIYSSAFVASMEILMSLEELESSKKYFLGFRRQQVFF